MPIRKGFEPGEWIRCSFQANPGGPTITCAHSLGIQDVVPNKNTMVLTGRRSNARLVKTDCSDAKLGLEKFCIALRGGLICLLGWSCRSSWVGGCGHIRLYLL